jgi:transcriptional regulator with XRE-family HTH domain
LSQVQLAEKLNITQGAVSQWEMGLSNPKSEILPELAKALNCTIDELFKKR